MTVPQATEGSFDLGVRVQSRPDTERFDTVIVGGGQAGLSVGYHLARRGAEFVILDENAQTGDNWRNAWDSLRLFTPARYAGLPGMPFPGRGDVTPTKEQTADYLTQYARHFSLPVHNGVRVDRLWKEGDRFVVTAGNQRFEAENVVVAMANYQVAKVPAFAKSLDPDIVQLHSHQYRNPAQLHDGGVLVVGLGNSGADIAIEVARSHPTWLAGKESGTIPVRIDTFFARFFFVRLVRFLGHHILTVKTPMGRKARPKMLGRAAPLVRVKLQDLEEAGIKRVPRVVGMKDGLPLLANGHTIMTKNVIWCTGYHHGFPWIDLPVFDQNGDPIHQAGIVENLPGLYFVGLHFLYSMTSATLIGVGRDAERIVKAIGVRWRATSQTSNSRSLVEVA